jgi:cell division protein FtsL
MYYQGNLALDETRKQQNSYKEVKRTVKRRKPIPTQEKLLYLFTILVCVVIAGFVIFRYAQIYEVNAKLQQMEKDIQMLENENNTMQLEVNQLANPDRLIDRAKQLGLRQSDEQEISEIPQLSEFAELQNGVAYQR